MVVLALDLGRRRIGVALSDPSGTLARPHGVLPAPADEQALGRVLRPILQQYEVEEIVLGHPRRLGGERGPEAATAERMAQALERQTGLPVHLWDERLSTVEAERILRERGVRGRRRRQLVDQVAAAVILQGYLDHRAGGGSRR